ncbi:hypothetical protein Fcan01_26326 [Folsomia candida]|uniref:Ig-like domain-containing protein n=1 Tax=Folsomia candida TaxID=158441 RepID=A0A226D291_FOLCA|nr:hypothetical protein Fcan01_26326 [Folsomia candida]
MLHRHLCFRFLDGTLQRNELGSTKLCSRPIFLTTPLQQACFLLLSLYSTNPNDHSQPVTHIEGLNGRGSELFLKAGSTINLTCIVEDATDNAPKHILWKHNSRIVNFEWNRGGMSLITEKKSRGVTVSRLLIQKAARTDRYVSTIENHTTPGARRKPTTSTFLIVATSPDRQESKHPYHYACNDNTHEEIMPFARTKGRPLTLEEQVVMGLVWSHIANSMPSSQSSKQGRSAIDSPPQFLIHFLPPLAPPPPPATISLYFTCTGGWVASEEYQNGNWRALEFFGAATTRSDIMGLEPPGFRSEWH